MRWCSFLLHSKTLLWVARNEAGLPSLTTYTYQLSAHAFKGSKDCQPSLPLFGGISALVALENIVKVLTTTSYLLITVWVGRVAPQRASFGRARQRPYGGARYYSVAARPASRTEGRLYPRDTKFGLGGHPIHPGNGFVHRGMRMVQCFRLWFRCSDSCWVSELSLSVNKPVNILSELFLFS